MTNTVIFWTQIGSVLSFIVVSFVLYKILVETKDATIQLQKEKISVLEDKLRDALTEGPDILVEKYAQRVTLLSDELERLAKDHVKNANKIVEKETELEKIRKDLSILKNKLERAQSLMGEFFCKICNAPMLVREYHSQLVEHEGRELDVDHEYIVYECGLTIRDGEEQNPCKNQQQGFNS